MVLFVVLVAHPCEALTPVCVSAGGGLEEELLGYVMVGEASVVAQYVRQALLPLFGMLGYTAICNAGQGGIVFPHSEAKNWLQKEQGCLCQP